MTTFNLIGASKPFLVLLFVFVLCLVLFYIIQINLLVSATYLVSAKEKEVQKISQEAKTLRAQHAALLSLPNAEEVAARLQFEKVTSVTYISSSGATVAQGPSSR